MSRNIAENLPERKLVNTIRQLSNQNGQQRTLQQQGSQSIQIGYTDDAVFHINMAPNTGLIGTFVFTLQYDSPIPGSVVFGDVDIAVNKGSDIFSPTYNLSAYFGTLTMEVINDQYLVEGWAGVEGYFPIVKVVKLRTSSSAVADDFYIHNRWRYVGVGNTLEAVTGDISIIP